MGCYELESTGGADWRGFCPGTDDGTHWEIAIVDNAPWMLLVQVAFNFHWGNLSLDEDIVLIGRDDILTLRAAAPNGASAFDTAVASTAAASSYAAMCAAATTAGVTGPQRPENVCRRWWLSCAADYPLT